MNIGDTNTILDGVPKANCEAEVDEYMINGLQSLFAKGYRSQFGHPRACKRPAV
jgi:hypothetical protein